MKKFMLLFLLITSFLIPSFVYSKEDKPYYLAVFQNPIGNNHEDWSRFKPDLCLTASTWDDFTTFLAIVKKQAKGKPIVLDIEVHGDAETGLLFLDYSAFNTRFQYAASVGYVTNKIDEYLGNKVSRVYLEACYSELCMEKTFSKENFTNNKTPIIHSDGDQIEPDNDGIVKFPMYGIGSCTNYNNTVFLQDYYNVKAYFYDLRDFINKTPSKKHDERQDTVLTVFTVLSSYGQ